MRENIQEIRMRLGELKRYWELNKLKMEKIISILIKLDRKAANVEELISDITSDLATRLINQ